MYGVSLDKLKEHYPELEEIQCIKAEDHDVEEIVILLAKVGTSQNSVHL